MQSTYESRCFLAPTAADEHHVLTSHPSTSVAFQVNYMDARGELDDDAELEAELDAEQDRDQDYDSEASGGDDASSSSDDEDEEYIVVSAAEFCPPRGDGHPIFIQWSSNIHPIVIPCMVIPTQPPLMMKSNWAWSYSLPSLLLEAHLVANAAGPCPSVGQ